MGWSERKALVQTKRVSGTLVVSFNICSIGERHLEQIARELWQAADEAESHQENLLIDFVGVQAMNSAMLGKLVTLNKRCRDRKVTLKLCNMQPDWLRPDGFGFSGEDEG